MPPSEYLEARAKAQFHIQVAVEERSSIPKTSGHAMVMGQVVKVFRTTDKLKMGDPVKFSIAVCHDHAEIPPSGTLWTTVEMFEKAPYIEVLTDASATLKPIADVAEIIIYSHEVLKQKNENTTDAEFEIISINCRMSEEPEPQTPIAMARNFLDLPGGTKAEYTAQQFAEAIVYWSRRAMRK